MRSIIGLSILLALLLTAGEAYADNYADTMALFRNAGDSAQFCSKSYAYAVFPTVGEAGFIVGGAHGKGRVYASGGKKDANTKSLGYQKGVAVYTIAKGGLMYTVTVAGQKFTYTPRGGE